MKDNRQETIRQRFNENFGIKRLPMFASCIRDMEDNGHFETAKALKSMLKQELSNVPPVD